MKKLNKDETKEITKEIYESENMQEFIAKEYDMYSFLDKVLEVRKKCAIDKTIYYDDETEAPDVTEEFFIEYNMSNFYSAYHILEKDNFNKPIVIYNYSNNNKIIAVCQRKYYCDYLQEVEDYKRKGIFVCTLNDEQIDEYNEIMEEKKAEYIERLKKYYKKYRDKISVIGYWANR